LCRGFGHTVGIAGCHREEEVDEKHRRRGFVEAGFRREAGKEEGA
jgi:hypothetical protein